MRVGTSYFFSKATAIRYYSDYGYDDVIDAVERKLAEGEIHIGLPPLKPGERAILIDNGTRYAVEDGQP